MWRLLASPPSELLIHGERLRVLLPFPAAPGPFFEGLNPGGGRPGGAGL